MLKKCKRNLGFRLSLFERYMAEKLSLSIELPVWRVARTWSKSLFYVFKIFILYHWLLFFVRKCSQIAACNQKLLLLHARRWWAFASSVIRFQQYSAKSFLLHLPLNLFSIVAMSWWNLSPCSSLAAPIFSGKRETTIIKLMLYPKQREKAFALSTDSTLFSRLFTLLVNLLQAVYL